MKTCSKFKTQYQICHMSQCFSNFLAKFNVSHFWHLRTKKWIGGLGIKRLSRRFFFSCMFYLQGSALRFQSNVHEDPTWSCVRLIFQDVVPRLVCFARVRVIVSNQGIKRPDSLHPEQPTMGWFLTQLRSWFIFWHAKRSDAGRWRSWGHRKMQPIQNSIVAQCNSSNNLSQQLRTCPFPHQLHVSNQNWDLIDRIVRLKIETC